MTNTHQQESEVVAAVEKIVALRKLSKDSNLQTTRAQSEVLKALPLDVLARVAVILAQLEGGVR